MDKKKALGSTLKGAAHTLLPLHAWKDAVGIKDSAKRIHFMLKNRQPAPIEKEELTPEESALQRDALEGKAMVMSMEEHDRFNKFVTELEWSQEDLDRQHKALSRAHFMRFAILIFATVLLPYILYEYGFFRATFCMALIAYTVATCLKTTCMMVQLEEKALWSFAQLRDRPNYWLYRRAFWIQD